MLARETTVKSLLVTALPTPDDVLGALRGVIDPELHDNVVDLGMIRGHPEVTPDGVVSIHLALTIAGCPLRTQLRQEVTSKVGSLPGVTDVHVKMGEMTQEERTALMQRARWKARDEAPDTEIPALTRVLAIASGKGGVGKSSITVNLAASLALRGLIVGVLDADIWGFSVPRMLGVSGRLSGADGKIHPNKKQLGDGLLKVVSMGHLVDDEDTAIMWRGLILTRALEQFLTDVRWGPMDYLLIDMPPGTGDIQMSLARLLPRTEMVIVTTPALSAQKVAIRAADMARRGYLKVAGVIENMSSFTCEHGQTYPLFGEGGGHRLAKQLKVELLAQVPVEPSLASGSDSGVPAALGQGPIAQVFCNLAHRIVTEILPPLEMEGCTARMMRAIEEATSSAG
jgi:ATP-binding protein involved in chromosome partitioning